MGQYGMVIDLNKCIGCQTCTVACKVLWTNNEGQEHMYWRNVETRPGAGYPRDWEKHGGGWKPGYKGNKRDVPLGEVDPGLKKGSIPEGDAYGGAPYYDYKKGLFEGELFDKEADKVTIPPEGMYLDWGANWDEDVGKGDTPDDNYYFYLPRLCNHCKDPACVASCPRHAIYKREEDGIVLIDQTRCDGYRFCVAECPYGKIYFNQLRNKSEKCIFCYPRVEKGVPPACAMQCPGRAMIVGDVYDKGGSVNKLVEEYKVALPLHPEYGTSPNIYYIPPLSPYKIKEDGSFSSERRIPLEYLGSLFGGIEPVKHALEVLRKEMKKYSEDKKSELMDILTGTQRSYFQLIHSKGVAYGQLYQRKGMLHLTKEEIGQMDKFISQPELPEAPK